MQTKKINVLKQIKNVTVTAVSSFLCEVAKCSSGFSFQIDFSKGNSKIPLKAFFVANGFSETLEASRFHKVDQNAPFIASVVDFLCGSEGNAEVAAASSLKVDLASFVIRRWDEMSQSG